MAYPDIIELPGPSSNLLATPDVYDSAAVEDSAVPKGSPGNLYGMSGYNNSGSTVYIQIHNATSLPAASTAVGTGIIVKVLANTHWAWDAGRHGTELSVGIVIAASSTATTLTVKTDSNQLFRVDYK